MKDIGPESKGKVKMVAESAALGIAAIATMCFVPTTVLIINELIECDKRLSEMNRISQLYEKINFHLEGMSLIRVAVTGAVTLGTGNEAAKILTMASIADLATASLLAGGGEMYIKNKYDL